MSAAAAAALTATVAVPCAPAGAAGSGSGSAAAVAAGAGAAQSAASDGTAVTADSVMDAAAEAVEYDAEADPPAPECPYGPIWRSDGWNGAKVMRAWAEYITGPERCYWRARAHQETMKNCCSGCARPFTLFVRRHFCRECALLFCSACQVYRVPSLRALARDAHDHPIREPLRMCTPCADGADTDPVQGVQPRFRCTDPNARRAAQDWYDAQEAVFAAPPPATVALAAAAGAAGARAHISAGPAGTGRTGDVAVVPGLDAPAAAAAAVAAAAFARAPTS